MIKEDLTKEAKEKKSLKVNPGNIALKGRRRLKLSIGPIFLFIEKISPQ